MLKEHLHPHYRKVYRHEPEDSYISYRLEGPSCTKAVQFIHFNTPQEATKYFQEVL
jgi:hypothetical protein